MNALETFPWPKPPGSDIAPRWTGSTFDLSGNSARLLIYDAEPSHWSNDLTSLHEETAGRDHPIDLASRRLAIESMRRLSSSVSVIMDVGCSSGFVLEDLRQALPQASLIGADYLSGPLEGLAARMPGLPILQFDLRSCPLPEESIDGITCLNVLEHIDDHEAAMRNLHRVTKRGGLVHVEVPAGPNLYDIYDEHLLHHRRYRQRDLLDLARSAGFYVERATHLGFTVFLPFWITKKRNRRKLRLPSETKAGLVAAQIRATRSNPLFARLIELETTLGRRLSYPCGIRCVALLRKP